MKVLIAAFAALLMSILPVAAAKRIALVIGNSSYEHVVDLRNPTNDADLMEKTLKDVGFEVTRLNDLDQRAMKKAMVEFGRKLKEGAEASMFYYAGHGVEVSGVNYLVPVDADTQNQEEADIQNVSVNSFLSLTENSSVPLNIVILDACRNNPFRSLRTSGSGGLAPVKAPRGTYVAYATAPGAVADDGDSINSPFTLALSESIKQPGLTLEGVFKLTRSKVQLATKGAQLPFDSSAITGDFYFLPETPAEKLTADPPQPQTIIQQRDPAQEAYQAAGDDPDLLKVVIDRFGDTVWADLAKQKLKKLGQPAPVEPAAPPVEKAEEDSPATQPPAVEAGKEAESEPAMEKTEPSVTEEDSVDEPSEPKSVVKKDTTKEKVKSVRKKEPQEIRRPPVRKKRTVRRSEPEIIIKKPRQKTRVIVAPKKRIVVEPKRKPAPVAKPVRAANYPFCNNGLVRTGQLCRTMTGQVCRVGFVSQGRRGGGVILRSCR